jgi:hypothetical protein
MIMSSESIDLWKEGAQSLRVRAPRDILINCRSVKKAPITPEIGTLTSIVLDLVENAILRIDFLDDREKVHRYCPSLEDDAPRIDDL